MSTAPERLAEFVQALERGVRFEFPEDMHKLARRAIARKATYPSSPSEVRAWAERLAVEAG